MTSSVSIDENRGNISLNSSFSNLSEYQSHRWAINLSNALQILASEAYMNGLELPDPLLKSILDQIVTITYQKFPFLAIPYEWILTESKPIAEGSKHLMDVQYNLPAELFKLMLGEGKLMYPKYTMALWDKGASNLEQAQIDMIQDAIDKLQIQDGDEILDLGCGFGSASHYILAKFPNVKVTASNLSKEHCNYIRQKMQDPESYFHSDRFILSEADFNEVTFDKKFDKIIAIGLFEHIGNLTNGFKKVASFLKQDGRVFVHIISTRLPHNFMSTVMEKYIFPRARVWSFDSVPTYNQDLKTIDKWFINGSNYAKTLIVWLENFDRYQDQIKTLDYGMNYAKFRRMWRLYLLWCISYFQACNGEVLGNGQFLMVHA